jgi:hypothetical protein
VSGSEKKYSRFAGGGEGTVESVCTLCNSIRQKTAVPYDGTGGVFDI